MVGSDPYNQLLPIAFKDPHTPLPDLLYWLNRRGFEGVVICNFRIVSPVLFEMILFAIGTWKVRKQKPTPQEAREEFEKFVKIFFAAKYVLTQEAMDDLFNLANATTMIEMQNLIGEVWPVRPAWDEMDGISVNNRNLLWHTVVSGGLGTTPAQCTVPNMYRGKVATLFDLSPENEAVKWDFLEEDGTLRRVDGDNEVLAHPRYPRSWWNEGENANHAQQNYTAKTAAPPPPPAGVPPPPPTAPAQHARAPEAFALYGPTSNIANPGRRYRPHPRLANTSDPTTFKWTPAQNNVSCLTTVPTAGVMYSLDERNLKGFYMGLLEPNSETLHDPKAPCFPKGSSKDMEGIPYVGFPAQGWFYDEVKGIVKVKTDQGTFAKSACFKLTNEEKDLIMRRSQANVEDYHKTLRRDKDGAKKKLEEHGEVQYFREESHAHFENSYLPIGSKVAPHRFDELQLGPNLARMYYTTSHTIGYQAQNPDVTLLSWARGLLDLFRRQYQNY